MTPCSLLDDPIDAESTARPPIIQLWLLRILVPMRGLRQIQHHSRPGLSVLSGMLGLDTVLADDAAAVNMTETQRTLASRHQALERMAADIRAPQDLHRNVERLRELVGMTEVDARLLEFVTLLHTERVLNDVADTLGSLSTREVLRHLAELLQRPETDLRESFSPRGALVRAGLVSMSDTSSGTLHNKLDILSEKFVDRMINGDAEPAQLMRDLVCVSAPGHLTLADFAHVQPTLDVLQPYLRQAIASGRRGVNVLIYGSPGVGKNQLVKAMAQALAVELFEVSSEDSDGDPMSGAWRLCAYRAAQSFFGQRKSLILFDEVEDIFQSDDELRRGRLGARQQRKAWINRMLEGNAVPAFWLSNSIDCLDAAFIRRFDVVLELTVPPRLQREQIIRGACQGLLEASAVARMAECQALAPAVVTRAAEVIRTITAPVPGGTAAAMQRLINSTLTAQGHSPSDKSTAAALPAFYDPRFVNTDANLLGIAAGLSRTGEGRLCLYGPPGTGKTAYARWLARELDKPAMVVRASDLMSKWVGGNEKNIARIFQQAEDDGAVLVIDEVDSFLQDRREARQNWEITLVNEMLTQMESFSGIFIASTNLMEGFDPAALRRFDLKLRFDALRPAQALALCQEHCSALGLPAPDAAGARRLQQLGLLTPGDFIAVARQHRFKPFASVADLLTALEGECALKQPRRAAIGFVP